MKSVVTRAAAFAVCFVTTFGHLPASAHAGCARGPFAEQFGSFLTGGFKVRELTTGTGNSYITDGRGGRIDLDVGVQAAVRRLAGAMATADESLALYAPPQWREVRQYYRGYVLEKLNHFFDRRFWIELVGTGTEVLYEFGLPAAILVVVLESAEHSVNYTPVSFCPAIYGFCAVTSNELSEMRHLITKPYPTGAGFFSRLSLWLRSKVDRVDLWRRLATVQRDGEKGNLNRMARYRSYRDFDGGLHTLYGGWLRPGFLRNALVRPICEDCAPPPGRGLRYGRFGRPERSKVLVATGAVPEFADLGAEMSVGERVMRTEEYISVVNMIFRQAHAAASDLTLSADGVDWAAWRRAVKDSAWTRRPDLARLKDLLLVGPWPAYEKGIVDSWWKRGLGFVGLRRDLARMRKSYRLYRMSLRMRAYTAAPRTADEAAIDREFATTFSALLHDYTARIQVVSTGAYTRRSKDSPLFQMPRRARASLEQFMNTGKFCAAALAGG